MEYEAEGFAAIMNKTLTQMAILLMTAASAAASHASSPPFYPSRMLAAAPSLSLLTLLIPYAAPGAGTGIWTNAYASARELVGLMTLEEQVNITRGFTVTDNVCAGNTGTVPRLSWPGLCLHDAGNGVRATDMVSSYPSAIHVGASWDRNLTYWRGLHMGKEFKAKGGTRLCLIVRN